MSAKSFRTYILSTKVGTFTKVFTIFEKLRSASPLHGGKKKISHIMLESIGSPQDCEVSASV